MCWRPVSGVPIGKPRSIFTVTDSPTLAPAAGEVIVTGVLLPEAALVLVPPPLLQAAATSARAPNAAISAAARRPRRRAAGVDVVLVSMPGDTAAARRTDLSERFPP